MLDLITIPVAVILGFLAGLGVGGGSLLILWLTVIIGMPYNDARIINLLFFLPSALISTFFRWKQHSIDFRKILPAILWGCCFAAVFAVVSQHMQTDFIKKCFGILLIFTGIRELFYRPRKPK